MKGLWRLKIHICLIVGFIGCTVAGQILLKERHAAERRQIEQMGRERRVQELVAVWNSRVYTDPGEPIPVEQFINAIQWQSADLSDQQLDQLENRLREVFAYLRQPCFEEYFRLRTEGFKILFELSPEADYALRHSDPTFTESPPRSSRDIIEALWWIERPEHAEHNSGALTAVCLDCITGTVSDQNTVEALLSGPVSKQFTVARAAINPGFDYPRKTSVETFVQLSFFARSNVSTNAGPVFMSFGWSEVEQDWFLGRLVTDNLLSLRVLF